MKEGAIYTGPDRRAKTEAQAAKVITAIRSTSIIASSRARAAPDGRAKTEAQGAKVISAIVKVGCQNEDEYHPADAINLCRNLANG